MRISTRVFAPTVRVGSRPPIPGTRAIGHVDWKTHMPGTILRLGKHVSSHAPGKPRRRGQVELNHILVPRRTGRRTPRHTRRGDGGAQREGGRVAAGADACRRVQTRARADSHAGIRTCAHKQHGGELAGQYCPWDSAARRAAVPLQSHAGVPGGGAWPPQRYNAWLSSCGGEEAAAAHARRGRRLAGPPLTKELVTGGQDRASRFTSCRDKRGRMESEGKGGRIYFFLFPS